MFKTLYGAALAAALATVAPMASAQTPAVGDLSSAIACAQTLDLLDSERDMVVLSERGAGNVDLLRSGEGGDDWVRGDVTVKAFDIHTCQLVELNVWMQEDGGDSQEVQTGPEAHFPGARFLTGTHYVRAQRALDRDMGYVVSVAD